jgi:outer membrane protein insertion porin family
LFNQRQTGLYDVISRILIVFGLILAPSLAAAGQDPPAAQAPAQVPAPQAAPAQPPSGAPSCLASTRPPAPGSGPVICQTELRFHPVNESIIEAPTYLYYIQTPLSLPSQGTWVPFNEQTEQSLLEDFKRLWATNFLDNLWIETVDVTFPNGVAGKHVIYHMEERPRVKIVDYTGSTKVERTKIDEKMKELGIALRLDSFLDQSIVRRVQGIVKSFMADKGYEFAEVTSSVEPLPAGPKLVKVVFDVKEGPKVKVRTINFNGNSAVSDRALGRQMKSTKAHGMLSWITGKGVYNEAKFDEDAEKVIEYYRNKGYISARVGQPEIKTIEDSADKETRWVQLNIPIDEGPRYRVGKFDFEGNKIIKTEFLQPFFKLKPGDWYSDKPIRNGLVKAREGYGSLGYFEFTGFPDLKPIEAAEGPIAGPATPTVDVTMRMTEGEQYFVNRLTFAGNTTTRDNVIRREVRLLEGAPFNTEALKYSVKRLNQLGYFKPLEEGQGIDVQKTPGEKNQVDVTLKLEEQNRNQLTFGAGVSQFEGFFGQLSFQTSNFLGRGEALTVSLQVGSRSENYQVAFSEPFLFDRNITGGVDVYKRTLRYIDQFTQEATGGNLTSGFPLAGFSRMFVTYSYEAVKVSDLNPIYYAPELVQRNPYLRDSLLLGEGGRRTVSKITPQFVHNTVDNPIFPNSGKRITSSIDFAGIGGNTNFIKPRFEYAQFKPLNRRMSVGYRAQVEYIRPYASTTALPITETLYLGGEYTIRGYDIRSIGPRDVVGGTGLVLGGNKTLLFNAEYLINIAGPVRLVLFYDTGQVRDIGQSFAWQEDISQRIDPSEPPILDPFTTTRFVDPNAPPPSLVKIGETSAFKTSTGAEIRFFMPVLNVPFRLIFAYNPQRFGVLDNNLRPAKKFTFKFAVGSTF